MELKSFVGLDEAIKKGSKYGPRLVPVKLPVTESVGKYSAEDVVAPADFPEHDRSAMDGYAVISSETISASRNGPAVFRLNGTIFPSSENHLKVEEGTAVKVMTGARIPEGADSVVMLEDSAEDDDEVKIYKPVRRYQNVSRRGEDIKRNFPILKKGQKITPPHLVALMECEIETVSVFQPSIAIVSTGDELVSGRVVNSTQPFIKAFFEKKGFKIVTYGSVRDDEAEILDVLLKMREDLVIVTGGTGPGEKDILPPLIEREGKLIFRGIRIRPGRTTSFGLLKGKPIFMISGLPVAALIASENVILELMSSWFSLEPEPREYGEGVLARSLVNTLGFRSFVRIRSEKDGEELKVVPTRVTGSGVIYSIIDADGILVMDENSEGIGEGERVKFEVLRW